MESAGTSTRPLSMGVGTRRPSLVILTATWRRSLPSNRPKPGLRDSPTPLAVERFAQSSSRSRIVNRGVQSRCTRRARDESDRVRTG